MKYEKKIEIILAAIRTETELSDKLIDKIRKGLIDGFLRIEHLETEEKRAVDFSYYFDVERIQEGYGFWNSGGYNTAGCIGSSAVAAGLDGEKLRQVRYLQERNGRHSLAVVYPGCYVAVSIARDTLECDNVSVYQIQGFSWHDGKYQARCKKVLQMDPWMSWLSEEQEERISRLIDLANKIAITPNLFKLRDWV